MNIRRIFSTTNILTAILYGGGLFGMHISLLIAVIIYIPSRSVTMPFRGAVLVVSVCGILYALNKRFRFYRGKLWIALLLFWGLYGLSIFLEPSMLLQQSRFSYALYAFGVCAIPMCAFTIITNRSNLRTGMIWLYISAFVAGAVSIALYGGASLHETGRAKGGEFIGDFVAIGPLLLSYAGSAMVVMGAYWVLVKESLPSKVLRYTFAAILGVIGAYMMALGASRGPVIAIAVPCVLFMFLRVRKASDVLVLLVGILGLTCIGFGMLFFADKMGSALGMRLKSLMNIQQTYFEGGVGVGRIAIYSATIQQFLGNPILGNGLYCRAAGSYPHNFILEAYMTTGIIGGTSFLVYLCTCVSRAIKIIRFYPVYSWVSLLFLHYAVYCQFSSGIITNHYFWYSSAMVIAVYEFCSKERFQPRRGSPV